MIEVIEHNIFKISYSKLFQGHFIKIYTRNANLVRKSANFTNFLKLIKQKQIRFRGIFFKIQMFVHEHKKQIYDFGKTRFLRCARPL